MKKIIAGIAFLVLVISSFNANGNDEIEKKLYGNIAYNENQFTAQIDDDEIWITTVNDPNIHIVIDRYGSFSCPTLSPTGYVAYKNYDDLYLCKIDKNQSNECLIVDKDVSSYAWQQNGDLVYSKYSGGLFVRSNQSNNTKVIDIGREFYSSIIPLSNTVIIGEKNGFKNINGYDYSYDLGIVKIDLSHKDQKFIMSSISFGDYDDLVISPKIIGVSRDGGNIFIGIDKYPCNTRIDDREVVVYNVDTEHFDNMVNIKGDTL